MSEKKIKVGQIQCGADELFLISGPCVIEEEIVMMKTAEKLKEVSERIDATGAVAKPSTPQQFDRLVRDEIVKRREVFRAAGTKVQ